MSDTPAERPSRVRYTILMLLCTLAMITYLDRAVVANSKDAIMDSLGKDRANWFYLAFAFQIAYALFEVPTGWMGDRFGPRSTLLRIVLWWTFFLGLTGLAGHLEIFGYEILFITFGLLIFVQFLFGMGEAGAFPNISRSLYNWFPMQDRGFASGTVWMSSRFMGGLTPLVWLFLTDADYIGLTWRQGFGVFVLLALTWCGLFYWWFRNTPEQHPATNSAEQDLIKEGKPTYTKVADHPPFRQLLASTNLRWICAMYFCINFGWYFLMYFLPGKMRINYLAANDGAPLSATDKILLSLLIGAPLLVGMFGCSLGGYLTDRFVRKTGNRRLGRKLYGMIGFGGCAASYSLVLLCQSNIWAFAAMLALMGFCNDLTMGSCWSICQDVGRKYAAVVSGCMNMVGNFGSIATIYFTGAVIKHYEELEKKGEGLATTGVSICMATYAVVYLVGIYFWYKIDATVPIIPDESDGDHP